MGFSRYIMNRGDVTAINRREADRLIGLGIIDSGMRDDEQHAVVFRLKPYMDIADALHELGRCVPHCNCYVKHERRTR